MNSKLKKRIETTNKWLKIFLGNYGYEFQESVNTEQGETFCFRKLVDGVPIHFQYNWDGMFERGFWEGRLSVTYDFEPEILYVHPLAIIEVNYIYKENIENLLTYERKLIKLVSVIGNV